MPSGLRIESVQELAQRSILSHLAGDNLRVLLGVVVRLDVVQLDAATTLQT